MKKHFYHHIVETSSISLALGDLEMTPEERVHLVSLAEANLHHMILDSVLSELSGEDKKKFLHLVAQNKHDEVWKLLKEKATDIEEKIRKAAAAVTKELHRDIEEAKQKH